MIGSNVGRVKAVLALAALLAGIAGPSLHSGVDHASHAGNTLDRDADHGHHRSARHLIRHDGNRQMPDCAICQLHRTSERAVLPDPASAAGLARPVLLSGLRQVHSDAGFRFHPSGRSPPRA